MGVRRPQSPIWMLGAGALGFLLYVIFDIRAFMWLGVFSFALALVDWIRIKRKART